MDDITHNELLLLQTLGTVHFQHACSPINVCTYNIIYIIIYVIVLYNVITYNNVVVFFLIGFEVAVEHPHPHVAVCTDLIKGDVCVCICMFTMNLSVMC